MGYAYRVWGCLGRLSRRFPDSAALAGHFRSVFAGAATVTRSAHEMRVAGIVARLRGILPLGRDVRFRSPVVPVSVVRTPPPMRQNLI